MFNINMSTLSGLAVGILVGVAATLATHANQADAQRAQGDYYGSGAWRAEAVPMTDNGPAVAWRINSFTGQMEMCTNAKPQPTCVAMPQPGQ
jgi:TctA family transporter